MLRYQNGCPPVALSISKAAAQHSLIFRRRGAHGQFHREEPSKGCARQGPARKRQTVAQFSRGTRSTCPRRGPPFIRPRGMTPPIKIPPGTRNPPPPHPPPAARPPPPPPPHPPPLLSPHTHR